MTRARRTFHGLLVGAYLLLGTACSQIGQREHDPVTSPQAHADLADVLETQHRRFAAMIAGDLATLELLLADDLTYVHTTGRLETKPEFLRSLATRAVRYRVIRAESLEARLYGHVAVVTGRSRMEVESGSQELRLLIRFTDVYAREGAEWRQVAWQSTRVPVVEER